MDLRIDKDRLLRDIERYFDCCLTDEEESRLMTTLSATDIKHPDIEEAKAILGFRTLNNSLTPDGKVSAPSITVGLKVRRILQYAAVALILVAAGLILKFSLSIDNPQTCIAYYKGKSLTDEDAVMRLMIENLSELEGGVDEMERDVSEELWNLLPIDDCNIE